MKTTERKTVSTKALSYARRVVIYTNTYVENDNLYVGLDMPNGEAYCDLTTNLSYPLPFPYAFVKDDAELTEFIEEQNLGEFTGRQAQSGFNTYNLYRFNIEQ